VQPSGTNETDLFSKWYQRYIKQKNVASVKYSIIWKKEVDINTYIAFYVKSVSESIWKKPLLLGTKETNTLQIQGREGQTSLMISHYVNFFVIRTLVVPCYLCGLVTGLQMGIKICGCLAGCCGSHLVFFFIIIIIHMCIQRLGHFVAHTCNPSYLGGGDWQDHSLRLTQETVRPHVNQ
jgi:hypothetical protein